MKTLQDYLDLWNRYDLVIQTQCDPSIPIGYVSCDSQDVQPNTLFLVKGAHFRAQYLADACERGAVCYVAEAKHGVEGQFILVRDIRRAMSLAADFFYDHAWEKLNVIGITGTKGKSTTAYFVKYMLDDYLAATGGQKSAIISSIDTYDGKEEFESHLTTPEPLDLHRHFANAVESDITHLTMEVSSQALKYGRVDGVTFTVGCFLNIGDDHISDVEHPTFEDYFQSKLRIFSQCRTACVNLDCDHADAVLAAARKAPSCITFSQKRSDADVYAYGIHKVGSDTVFRVKTKDFDEEFVLTIPGLFNVENALAAIAISQALAIPLTYQYTGLMKARSSGRMEVYTNTDKRVTVIVDYAHNQMSFENLFASVKKEFPGQRVVIVFGCPGKKALLRRRDLGTVAGQNSDMVYLTEEDSGEEPTRQICEEIATHVAAQNCPYEIFEDRGEAIRRAILDCTSETVVLITGKGNETRQKRGLEYIDCPSDVEYAKRFLIEYDEKNDIFSREKIRGFQDILPALHRLYGRTVVIKLGGSVLEEENLIIPLLEDVALLSMVGARVVVVHGGGKRISKMLTALGLESRFERGYRVTDQAAVEVVEMVLSGSVNKRLVSALRAQQIEAVGISGKDGGILAAKKKLIDGCDVGFVGEITHVKTDMIDKLLSSGYACILSPVGFGAAGETFNINADDAACAVAAALGADSLIFVTDVDGIFLDQNNEKTLIGAMSVEKAQRLMANGLVGGGMIPKLAGCIRSIESGVGEVVILNGTVRNNLISNFISPQNAGTTISNS